MRYCWNLQRLRSTLPAEPHWEAWWLCFQFLPVRACQQRERQHWLEWNLIQISFPLWNMGRTLCWLLSWSWTGVCWSGSTLLGALVGLFMPHLAPSSVGHPRGKRHSTTLWLNVEQQKQNLAEASLDVASSTVMKQLSTILNVQWNTAHLDKKQMLCDRMTCHWKFLSKLLMN